MTTADFEKSIIALALWESFPGEPVTTMMLGAQVLRNRANQGQFEGSLYQNAVAALREDAFSKLTYPDPRDPLFQQLLLRIDGVYEDTVSDRTGGALYWTTLMGTETLVGERTVQSGRYVFYKH